MKNNTKTNNRNYKPTKISESLKNLNRKFLYKFGKLDYIIHSKWGEIVGPFFLQHSEPVKIQSLPESQDHEGNTVYTKYLHVDVNPAAALEFQHFQNQIIEKINSFFGYNAINGIKIHQKFIKKENDMNKSKSNVITDNDEEKEKLKSQTPKIHDNDLKESILNLGLSIKNEEKQ
tara:strand:- start:576 stop:1100 length:525 start_codon:yes stop_codon:yes gene_type:complete